jgi:hypothetical protein
MNNTVMPKLESFPSVLSGGRAVLWILGLLLALGWAGPARAADATGAPARGVPIISAADLERWMQEISNWGRWEFLFIGDPLRVPGGTGSPLNPLAVF